MSFTLHGMENHDAVFVCDAWNWRPLALYCQLEAPDITRGCLNWQAADGDGLDEGDCIRLATVLDGYLETGDVKRFEEECARQQAEYGVDELSHYKFKEETVREFSAFLKVCGGFRIW